MRLEQELYQTKQILETGKDYSISDLEQMSVLAFYSEPLGGGGFDGFGSGMGGGSGDFGLSDFSPAISRPLKIISRPLTIRDFPESGFQLHIHEGEGGFAQIKTYGGEKFPISSYDAAMADLLADSLDIDKILRNLRLRRSRDSE